MTVLREGSPAFLRLRAARDSAGQPHLEPVRIIESTEQGCIVTWPLPLIDHGAGVDLMFEDPADARRAFQRLEARVEAFEQEGTRRRALLSASGAPSPAERRGAPRICARGRGLHAQLGSPIEHVVCELGPGGFGVLATPGLLPGQGIGVTLLLAGDRIPCDVIVRSARVISEHSVRYGVSCQTPSAGSAPLRFVDLYAALKHGVTEPLRSDFEDDPEMVDLVEEFSEEVLLLADQAEELCERRAYVDLRTLAHGLKGAGGGYGFARITEVAAELEQALVAAAPHDEILARTERLLVVLRSVRISAKTLTDA